MRTCWNLINCKYADKFCYLMCVTCVFFADYSNPTMSANGCLEYACLGRTMELGMLYDCRSERIIPGVTLWDLQVLRNNTDIKPCHFSNCKVSTDDSFESKCQSLDINADIKLSFIAGLVSVKGSAKYLTSKKSSKNEARVVLEYHCTRSFEQQTMNQLGNIKYSEVFEKGTATHVVTGVEYGADASLYFITQ